MKTRISVQERLKDLRVERGLNLEELAQETGISKSAVENAMKASATSDKKSMPSMMRCGTRPRQYGPRRMPATM